MLANVQVVVINSMNYIGGVLVSCGSGVTDVIKKLIGA